eukprot:UN01010
MKEEREKLEQAKAELEPVIKLDENAPLVGPINTKQYQKQLAVILSPEEQAAQDKLDMEAEQQRHTVVQPPIDQEPQLPQNLIVNEDGFVVPILPPAEVLELSQDKRIQWDSFQQKQKQIASAMGRITAGEFEDEFQKQLEQRNALRKQQEEILKQRLELERQEAELALKRQQLEAEQEKQRIHIEQQKKIFGIDITKKHQKDDQINDDGNNNNNNNNEKQSQQTSNEQQQ